MLALITFSDEADGDLESTSADKVRGGEVKSPNLMYCDTSIRKVVVQSYQKDANELDIRVRRGKGLQSSKDRSEEEMDDR